MSEDLKAVVRAFQADVQRALALFERHTDVDDLLSWRHRRLPRSGHLDLERRHRFAFHGAGVRVRLAPGLYVDWDFGHDGRMDGFDLWRLEGFVTERPDLLRALPLDDLRVAFDAAVRQGAVASPWRDQGDHLYYLVDDL